MMNRVFLLLGTNLGQKSQNLLLARNMIGNRVGLIQNTSSIYKTAAWGKRNQPEFYNQVLILKTSFSALKALNILQSIELKLGRVRKEKWGERLIDIDILYFNDEVIEGPTLQIPHPGIPERRFTLVPLAQIAPDYRHPVLKKTQNQLLQECPDHLEVQQL